ncbi:hypothetical protein [Rubritepida flocculans]|uniref:hypothetical protein n=1 Tax=Rubritepida flocculans TaxID=182403 RepID=UPI0003F76202|nr:hypothetical protein [Rubritepida flocculans]
MTITLTMPDEPADRPDPAAIARAHRHGGKLARIAPEEGKSTPGFPAPEPGEAMGKGRGAYAHHSDAEPEQGKSTPGFTPPEAQPPGPPPPLRLVVTLGEPFASWLLARAEAHGESPEAHAAALLRDHWARLDHWRHERALARGREAGAA